MISCHLFNVDTFILLYVICFHLIYFLSKLIAPKSCNEYVINVINIKFKVILPQAYVTVADCLLIYSDPVGLWLIKTDCKLAVCFKTHNKW